jgi:ABC-2 type transport system permease protein
MASSFQQQQRFHKKVLALLIVGILILINLLSLRHFLRFDWTHSKQFTLSDSTKELISGLNDVVRVKAYFTDDLPPTVQPIRRYLKDLLDEYTAFSKGKVHFTFVNPAKNTNAGNETFEYGIQEVQLNIRQKDKFESVNGYMGLAIFFSDKVETIPVIQSLESLEYDITSRILKVISTEEKVVGFVTGHGEHGIETLPVDIPSFENENDYSLVAGELRKNLTVSSVSLSENDVVAAHTLVVAGPREAFSDDELFKLDQFILGGGRVLFLVDMVDNTLGLQMRELEEVNVNRILEAYGAGVSTNMVLDQVSDYAQFNAENGRPFLSLYPPLVRLTGDGFTDHPTVRDIDAFTVRWASSLNLVPVDGVVKEIIASSSPKSWQFKNGVYQLNPQLIPATMPEELESFPMIAVVAGEFPSAFADSAGKDIALDSDVTSPTFLSKSSTDSLIVVAGESDFLSNDALRGNPAAYVWFANTIDFLTLGDTLISIRSKNLGNAGIDDVADSTKTLLKVLGVGLMPFLFSCYGLFRLSSRRKEEAVS